MRILVQFGPNSPRQRCEVTNPSDLSVLTEFDDEHLLKKTRKFNLLFEILQQLDLTNIAFVGCMENHSLSAAEPSAQPRAFADAEEEVSAVLPASMSHDELQLTTLLGALSHFAPSFSQRCVWRAIMAGALAVGVWEDGELEFTPCDDDLRSVHNLSTIIIAAPTSEDEPHTVDERMSVEETAEVLDAVTKALPEDNNSALQWLLQLMSHDDVAKLDEDVVRNELRRLLLKQTQQSLPWIIAPTKESTREEYVEATGVTPSGSSPWTAWPRKPPVTQAVLPVFPLPKVSPSAPMDIDAIFLELFKEGGSLTRGSFKSQHPPPPKTRYQILMEVRDLDAPVEEAPAEAESGKDRLVDAKLVLNFLNRTFPAVDHGNGRGYEDLLRTCYTRPQRDETGRIVAGYAINPKTTSAIRTVANLSPIEKKDTNRTLKASCEEELSPNWLKTSVQARKQADTERIAKARAAAARFPPSPQYLTESEFKCLILKIMSM